MSKPRTATELLQVACRLEQSTLVRALGLSHEGYEPGVVFDCLRCRRRAAWEVSAWSWVCNRCDHRGTVAELAMWAVCWPEAMAVLLDDAEVI